MVLVACVFGVVAPNSGNQTILVKYGTKGAEGEVAAPAHRRRDGVGLLDDRAGEPGLRSPLPHHQRRAVRGDEWVINGHKWFTSK